MKGVIFTYLLVISGVFVPLLDPFAGFLIYACIPVLRPQALWEYALPAGARFDLIVAVGMLAGWAIHGFGSWRFGKAMPVIVSLLVFWIWLLVSASSAAFPEVAWPDVENKSKLLLPCVVAITLLDSVDRLKKFAWLIVVCQGYWALEFNRQYYAGLIDTNGWNFASLDNNGLAIMMSTSLGLAFFLGLHSSKWWQRMLCFGLAFLMTHVVLFSMSRGGMLALAITGFVTFLIIPKRTGHYILFLIALLVVLRLAGSNVVEEFNSIFASEEERDESASSRLDLAKAMMQVCMDKPVSGVGPQNWPLISDQYGFKAGKAGHNTWAQAAAEMGVPGVASLLGFYLICLARLWPLTQENRWVSDPWIRYLARGVIASLTGYLVSATFVSVEGMEVPYYVALIGAGVLRVDSAARSMSISTTDQPWLAAQEAEVVR